MFLNVKVVIEFGISVDNIFFMWDWVGGCYLLWFVIGLFILLVFGFENFKGLFEGVFDMDIYFIIVLLEENMFVLFVLLGVWYRNFFDV